MSQFYGQELAFSDRQFLSKSQYLYGAFLIYLKNVSVWHYGTDYLWRWIPADYQQTWDFNAICPRVPTSPTHTQTYSVDLSIHDRMSVSGDL
jgi:hypothetical protein